MANNQRNITIDLKTAEGLFLEIEVMRKTLEGLRKKVLKILPPKYGSELWWVKSTKQAMKEIKAGKGAEFNNAEEAIKWLKA